MVPTEPWRLTLVVVVTTALLCVTAVHLYVMYRNTMAVVEEYGELLDEKDNTPRK